MAAGDVGRGVGSVVSADAARATSAASRTRAITSSSGDRGGDLHPRQDGREIARDEGDLGVGLGAVGDCRPAATASPRPMSVSSAAD